VIFFFAFCRFFFYFLFAKIDHNQISSGPRSVHEKIKTSRELTVKKPTHDNARNNIADNSSYSVEHSCKSHC